MSIWIEFIPPQKLISNNPTQKFSQIKFRNMEFRQSNAESHVVTLTAPNTLYDSEDKSMTIDRPSMQWMNPASGKIVSASSQEGVFHAETSESAMPAAFHYIILSGSAVVQGVNSRVDSDIMIFDNEKRLFLFPDPFTFHKGNLKLEYQEMYYDPIQDKPSPLDDSMKNDPELQKILASIGKKKS
ncbi:MAG: hypothetical protein ACP5I1_12335 [Candidatus Hinthialibacter sp.]